MKKGIILLIGIILLFPLILGVFGLIPVPINVQDTLKNIPIDAKTGIIEINNNGDFSTYATGGPGNSTHPWIIEDEIIDGTGQAKHGIEIHSTTAYFIIRNCTIMNTDNMYMGIYIESALNGLVTNCTVEDCGSDGITIEDDINVNITNNKISGNGQKTGIRVHDSSNCDIINNTITRALRGIIIYSQGIYTDNLIYNNTILESSISGIYSYILSAGDEIAFHNISSNTIIKNQYGIYLTDSFNNTLINNYLSNSSLAAVKLEEAHNSTVLHNTLIYNTNGIEILNTNGSTISNNNVINNTGWGIKLETSSYNTITYNTLQCNVLGCIFTDSSGVTNTIENNNCITDGCPTTGNGGGIPGFTWAFAIFAVSLVFILIKIRMHRKPYF